MNYDFCQSASGRITVLGCFDGVHLGHRALFRRAQELSEALCLPVCAFLPLSPSHSRLSSDGEQEEIMRRYGVSEVIRADFSAIREYSPERFVEEILLSSLHTEIAVCGFNFSFGAGAKGNAALLSSLLEERGRETVMLPPVLVGGEPVSSTRIRALLENGEADAARLLLGRLYRLCGEVEEGRRVGRTLDFPTANQKIAPSLLMPKAGVYATLSETEDGGVYRSVTNIGFCPTFGLEKMTAETHLLGFRGNLYGTTLRVSFLRRLRGEIPFPSAEALKEQISRDCTEAESVYRSYRREILKSAKGGEGGLL